MRNAAEKAAKAGCRDAEEDMQQEKAEKRSYCGLLQWGIGTLKAQEITEAASDAWILLEYVTGIDRTHYFLKMTESCPKEAAESYRELIGRRAQHMPVQYLTGEQEFMGYSFRVNEQVLIPRQDTELLVLEAEKKIRPGAAVLDMCTGSGCIIISLAKRCRISAFAADISEGALAVAQENATALQADVAFIKSDLFEAVEGKYDCIVSNPPYIASGEIPRLMPEVRDYEPITALDGSADGLRFYRRIAADAKKFLKPGGWVFCEIGFDQGKTVPEMFEKEGYQEIIVKKDLAGLPRVVTARLC